MATFTQRHYKVIAQVLNTEIVNNPDICKDGIITMSVEDIVNIFSNTFQYDNPNFKQHLFVKASGVQTNG